MKKTPMIILLALSLLPNLFACEMKFYSKTYYFSNKENLTSTDLIETTTCPEMLQNRAIAIVLNSAGPLKSSYLENAVSPPSIKIIPETFQINPISDYINASPGWIWEDVTPISGHKVFHGEKIKVNCQSCASLGRKTLQIKIDQNIFWASGNLKIMSKVLMAKTHLGINQESLSKDNFLETNMPVLNPDEYFTSTNELVYYRLNLELPEGSPLKKSNLRKIDLVNTTTPVVLNLIQGGIKIKGHGMPLSPGKLGDIIKVRNQKSNIILYGKVTGQNTLSIDL